MYGKHHSEETKRKISLAHKGKGLGNKHAVGSKGHTGLKWITDGIIEKTLPIGETPPPGFRFGRCYTKCKKENA